MDRLKRLAALLLLIVVISFCVSVVVFSWMRKDAIDKMLAFQEAMVIQSLSASSEAVHNLTRARLQKTEEILYKSLGVNMAFLKLIYDKRGRLPDQAVSSIIVVVSEYQKASELSREKRLSHVFGKDVLDFMHRVEKAGNGKAY